ncbi:MAG: aminomethyl-transferring glycine dehydrogenase subunit GcvPB [Tissierellia bacterium]|nr:aminomethyl-transferring glycine dehydrogenase subunit GcvPB [Tissierellia bacterium]
MREYDKVIFELSQEGRRAYSLPKLDVEARDLEDFFPEGALRKDDLDFPQVSQQELVRHYTHLSMKNYSLDNDFYPLGSCTMKYNPKINEVMARLDGFANIHPLQEEDQVQGALRLMYELDLWLREITGMDKMSLCPGAGAHGEFAGIMTIRRYHEARGDHKRNKIIVPDSAHGTNPATAAMAGCEIVEVKSDGEGRVDLDSLREAVGPDTCALMLTNPNTAGVFEKDIEAITQIVHEAGGLCYYDGANANAILGQVRPGDTGFDVVHLNLHKTFSTPHGGGGPGAGPIGVKKDLVDYLPKPTVEKEGDHYRLDLDRKESCGRLKDFQGHFGIMVRAYAYLLALGAQGLKETSTMAVLNANYIQVALEEDYNRAIPGLCMHECLFGGLKEAPEGIKTLDVAKRLMDKGFHPPTVYFPLIVPEALMIEPTESESKETLDRFIQAMKEIAQEAKTAPDLLKEAPHDTPVRRPDEILAARKPILSYQEEE